MIATKCKECGKSYKLKDTAAGKNINCECGNVVVIPLEPNLDENGEKIKPTKKSPIDSTSSENEEKGDGSKRKTFADLSKKKICSKCKNIFNMEIKECPKCGFNSMGIKYDETRRDEITRGVSQKIYKIGKYVIPGAIIIALIIIFNLQKTSLDALETLEGKVEKKILSDQKKMAEDFKRDVNLDTIEDYYLAEENDTPYFIAIPKDKDDSKFSFFGNGFFTLKHAGVCYVLKLRRGLRKVKVYYIEDENGEPIKIEAKDFEILPFQSLAYKIAF